MDLDDLEQRLDYQVLATHEVAALLRLARLGQSHEARLIEQERDVFLAALNGLVGRIDDELRADIGRGTRLALSQMRRICEAAIAKAEGRRIRANRKTERVKVENS